MNKRKLCLYDLFAKYKKKMVWGLGEGGNKINCELLLSKKVERGRNTGLGEEYENSFALGPSFVCCSRKKRWAEREKRDGGRGDRIPWSTFSGRKHF